MKQRTRFVQDGVRTIEALMAMLPDSQQRSDFRMDAGEALFFERQLEAVESRLYEVKYRELKYRDLIPINNSIGPGAEQITYYMFNKVGMAKVIANPTDDPPMADAFATRHVAQVRPIGSGFQYSTQDLRKAQFANVPLEMRKVDAARRAVREKENSIAWKGDADYGLQGVLTHANIPSFEVAQAAGGGLSRVWGVDKTPMEVLEDIATGISEIRTTTKEIHQPNTLLLPIKKRDYLVLTPVSQQFPNQTLYKWIIDPENGFGISRIEGLPELEASGPGGTDQFLLYERDSEVLEMFIPMEMATLPPQARNFSFVVPVEAENAGVVIRFPLALIFGYGI